MATLTYVYGDRAVVVGPLATFAEPHSYDLCADHAMRLTPPRGWDLVRLSSDGYVVVNDSDDLLAVVDAVREERPRSSGPDGQRAAGRPEASGPRVDAVPLTGLSNPPGRVRGHLRVLPGHGDTDA